MSARTPGVDGTAEAISRSRGVITMRPPSSALRPLAGAHHALGELTRFLTGRPLLWEPVEAAPTRRRPPEAVSDPWGRGSTEGNT